MNNEVPSKAGWIIRDENGVYQGAGQGKGGIVSNPLESEFQAIIMAMQHCWGRGYKIVIIEGDCQKAIDLLNRRGLHFHACNWIREALWWKQRFEEIKFTWIGREGNKVADKLAKQDIPFNNLFWFHYYVPRSITSDLHYDFVTSK